MRWRLYLLFSFELMVMGFSGTIHISLRCLRRTHSCGSFSKRIGRSWWKQGLRDGRLGILHQGLGSYTLDSIWGRVIVVICRSPICSTKRFWQGNILGMDILRIWILRSNNWGSLLGFWQCVWWWAEEKWFSSWLISWKCCLMSAKGPFRLFQCKPFCQRIYCVIFSGYM